MQRAELAARSAASQRPCGEARSQPHDPEPAIGVDADVPGSGRRLRPPPLRRAAGWAADLAAERGRLHAGALAPSPLQLRGCTATTWTWRRLGPPPTRRRGARGSTATIMTTSAYRYRTRAARRRCPGGIREIVVGTGGADSADLHSIPPPNSEFRLERDLRRPAAHAPPRELRLGVPARERRHRRFREHRLPLIGSGTKGPRRGPDDGGTAADTPCAHGGARPGGDHRRRRRRDVDRVPPDRARLERRRARRRAELTSGSTFHSAGLVGQLRELGDLTRMMMYGAELYRRLARRDRRRPVVARGRLAAARLDAGAVRGAAAPGGLGEDVRPAAGADHAPRRPSEASRSCRPTACSAPSGCRPTAGSTRPGWRRRSRRARARGAPTIRTSTRGSSAIDVERGRVTGVESSDGRRARRRSRPRSSSTPAACSRRRSARLAGVTVPIIPMAHQYLFTERDRGRRPEPAAAARPGQPRLLPRGGRRPVHGRLRARPGAVVARRRPGGLQRPAARAGLAALRVDHGGRDPPRPGDRGRRHHAG